MREPVYSISKRHPHACDSCGRVNDLEDLDGVVYCEECKAQIQQAIAVAESHRNRRSELLREGKLVSVRTVTIRTPWEGK